MNKPICYPLSAIILILLWAVQPLSAHGGGVLRMAAEPAGPYKVSAWTSPPSWQSGQVGHFTVSVAGEDDGPVLDAVVIIEMVALDTGENWLRSATTEQATNKLFYETDITLPEIGRYAINIQVSGNNGQGTASFITEILPPSRTSTFIRLGFILFGSILFIWLYKVWRKQPMATPSRQRYIKRS